MQKKRERPPKAVKNNLMGYAGPDAGILSAAGLGAYGFGGDGGAPVANSLNLFANLRNTLVTNYRQMLSQAYVEIGLVSTIIDVPVDDALRGELNIMSGQLSEEEIEGLKNEIESDDDMQIAAYAMKWDRLFGGGAVLIMTDQDPSSELDIEAIGPGSLLEFRAVDQWEIYGAEMVKPDGTETPIEESPLYNYYGTPLHRSRVLKINGKKPPSFIRGRVRGWGLSVVESLVRSINQYLKSNNLTYEVLDEFKIDVYKINGLVNALFLPGGKSKVMQTIQQINLQKNYQNAIVLDKEDDWAQKQLSFAGLAEAQQGTRMQIASDMRMPVCKLFGSQAGGLNPDDEADLEIYNGMVESEVRAKLKRPVKTMIQLKCQKLFGYIPDDLRFTFPPMRILKATDEEIVKTSKFTRSLSALQAGALTMDEFRDNCNKERLFSVHLDKDAGLELIDQASGPTAQEENPVLKPEEKPGRTREASDRARKGIAEDEKESDAQKDNFK